MCHVRFHNAHRHLNILDLLSHHLVLFVDLMKQSLGCLSSRAFLFNFIHHLLEIRTAVLFDLLNETQPLFVLKSTDSLLAIYGAAQDDVVGEPFFVEAPRIRHELLALDDHVKL